ncbi:uncharacterized protein LOC100432807 [Pongo abelii]|uniref:uncharacterized protein LOC100432807 n=1 Tax=Pongo abelii TaxID=9601 RepID=UPI0001D6053D|nr:uncharacterized protein LOC100432807 [Pongo abelii]
MLTRLIHNHPTTNYLARGSHQPAAGSQVVPVAAFIEYSLSNTPTPLFTLLTLYAVNSALAPNLLVQRNSLRLVLLTTTYYKMKFPGTHVIMRLCSHFKGSCWLAQGGWCQAQAKEPSEQAALLLWILGSIITRRVLQSTGSSMQPNRVGKRESTRRLTWRSTTGWWTSWPPRPLRNKTPGPPAPAKTLEEERGPRLLGSP